MSWPDPSYTRWSAHCGRPVVEDGLRLTVHAVVKASGAGPMMRRHGTSSWAWEGEAKPCSSIGWTISIDDDQSGILWLRYQSNGTVRHEMFILVSTPCRYGGRRWFALCPQTGNRVSMLHSFGSRGFLSRTAHKAVYRCQNEGRSFDRAIRQRNKLLRLLGTGDVHWQPKPKRMRWRTYDKLQARLHRCQAACDL